jgi:hypothetical protein
VKVSSAEVKVGSMGEIKLKALDIPEPGLGAWTVDIHYDPLALAVLSCKPLSGSVCNPDFAEGTVRVSGSSLEGLIGHSYLAALGVSCKQVGTAALELTVDTLVDATAGDPQPIAADVLNGKVWCFESEEPKPTDEPDKKHEGDASCDGHVDPIDATLVLQHEVDLIDQLPCEDKADVDKDGEIDSVDAVVILHKSAGFIE